MSGSRRSSRSLGGTEGGYSGSSRPTSARPPASSFSTVGQYGSSAGQQYGGISQEYDSRYGTDYQQYSTQYDTQYNSQFTSQYGGGTDYESAYTGASYQTGSDYNTRAAYDDYTSGYGREELLRRAYGDAMYDSQGQGARDTSSFNPYAELEQSRAAMMNRSTSDGQNKLTRPSSAKRTTKNTAKGPSSSFNVFGKTGDKAVRSSRSLTGDRQKPGASRYDALKRGDDSDDQNIPSKAEREQSRRRMDESYKQMMESYAEQQKTLSKRPQWINSKTRGALEPSDMTITHINQTRDLLDANILGAESAETQTAEEWLNAHSINNMKLSLKDLVDQGKIGKPGINRESGKVQQHIQFEATDLNEFEYKLNLAIETYTKRIKWLLMGSRKMFGVVKGNKVAVLVDTSDANCGFGRLTAFQEALGHLLDEQLSKKKKVPTATLR